MTKLSNPTPIFFDASGRPMDGGYVYVGVANADPVTNPINLYWDFARTIPVGEQPLRTIGGLIVNGTTPSDVFFAESDYSIRWEDSAHTLVGYTPSLYASASYQPLDSDLTAIAALTTTSYGRALLTLANQAALQAAVGLPAALPTTGGTVTGNIIRSGAGVHTYWNDAAMTGGRIFLTAVGASDPTSAPGDIWFQY